MTNPPQTSSNEVIAWSCISVSGPDAASFLQGQLTQDVSIVDADGAWSLVLAPDSIVIASTFIRRTEEGFGLVVESAVAETALKRLQRFLLRTDCQLNLSTSTDGPFVTVGDRVDRRWPGSSEFAGKLTPHTFGTTFVNSTISFTKGCFTGQELVGRLDARGSSVPWRLVHVSGADRQVIDAGLRSRGPGGPQGLTSWVGWEGRGEGLGIVHRTLIAEFDSLRQQGIIVQAID